MGAELTESPASGGCWEDQVWRSCLPRREELVYAEIK